MRTPHMTHMASTDDWLTWRPICDADLSTALGGALQTSPNATATTCAVCLDMMEVAT